MILRPYETGEWGVSGSLDEDADDDAEGDHSQPERHQYWTVYQAFCPSAWLLPWRGGHANKEISQGP